MSNDRSLTRKEKEAERSPLAFPKLTDLLWRDEEGGDWNRMTIASSSYNMKSGERNSTDVIASAFKQGPGKSCDNLGQ